MANNWPHNGCRETPEEPAQYITASLVESYEAEPDCQYFARHGRYPYAPCYIRPGMDSEEKYLSDRQTLFRFPPVLLKHNIVTAKFQCFDNHYVLNRLKLWLLCRLDKKKAATA